MEEVLSSALILVACISAGVSARFIARGRSSINKHSRQRIKDFENDIKYLAESKKEEAQDYRKEILRLKASINRIKDIHIIHPYPWPLINQAMTNNNHNHLK